MCKNQHNPCDARVNQLVSSQISQTSITNVVVWDKTANNGSACVESLPFGHYFKTFGLYSKN